MLSLRNELALWRSVSKKLDQIHAAKKEDRADKACPLCGVESVRVATMETMNGLEPGLKIGFFTCLSCNESWSGPIS